MRYMVIDFTEAELDALVETVTFGQDAVRNAQNTPYDLRQQKLDLLAAIAVKLRATRRVQ